MKVVHPSRIRRGALAIALLVSALAAAVGARQMPDRSKAPVPGPAPSLKLPPITRQTLSNGLPVWIVPMHEVPVVYPRSGEVNQLERKLLVNAVIGEDGFAWPIGVTTGPPTDDFSMTALGSIPLWRFAPLMIEGCPAPMPNATVGVSFVFR